MLDHLSIVSNSTGNPMSQWTVDKSLAYFANPVIQGFRAIVTGSHPTPYPPNVGEMTFAYHPGELLGILRSRPDTIVIHHGPAPASSDIVVHRLFAERILPFAPSQRGRVGLQQSDIADILTGRLRRWEQLGCGSGEIRLLAHGAPVNHRAMLEYIKVNFGVERIAATHELHGSYDALSLAAQDCDDCLVFGLRPSVLGTSGLVPISLDGIAPWTRGLAQSTPTMAISIAWRRDGLPDAILSERVGKILATIAGRVEADAIALDGLAPMVRQQAA